MKRIYVVEDLCNGCRLCETFCASLPHGVFSAESGRIRVLKIPGEGKSIPMVHCDGRCVRSIYDDGRPTCVGLCPTGALIYAEHDKAVEARREYEEARKEHSLFKIIGPWKWPFPWRRPGEKKARSPEGELV
jgi:Fe-S-cluster-containing dehydrogenase component